MVSGWWMVSGGVDTAPVVEISSGGGDALKHCCCIIVSMDNPFDGDVDASGADWVMVFMVVSVAVLLFSTATKLVKSDSMPLLEFLPVKKNKPSLSCCWWVSW